MRKALLISLYSLGGLLGLVVLAILAVFAVLRTEAGRDWVVATATEAVSTPGEMELRLAGLDGPFPGSIGIRGLEIADADGVWLSVGSARLVRSEEHTSELQSLMRNSYAVFCLKKKNKP